MPDTTDPKDNSLTAKTLSLGEKLWVGTQYALPHHLLSRCVGYFAESRHPMVKNTLISQFAKRFDVDMSDAAQADPLAYPCFNDFFTRGLKPGARPISGNGLCSPADGTVSQLGDIRNSTLIQAKGMHYTLEALLANNKQYCDHFFGGHFATIYLSPRDYHRVHMPITGTLKEMIYVPGRLFSVNTLTTKKVPKLFARNERVIALFETEMGPVAVIMVGAMIVASIETTWAGLVAPLQRKPRTESYDRDKIANLSFVRGAELGRFKLGSTVIILTPKGTTEWLDTLKEGSVLRMGEKIADTRRAH